MDKKIDNVDDYINQFDKEARSRLLKLREIVKDIAPEAEEGIMYGLVGYKLNKKPLVYFGGFSNHTGLYAVPHTHENFKEELSKYKQGKGSVQFPLDQPLPVDLIKKMVSFRRETLEATSSR